MLSHVIWVSTFALYAERQIGLDSVGVGYVLAYIGLISIILRGGLLPKLLDFFDEKRIKYAGVASIILGMVGSMFVNSWEGVLILATFFSFGSGVTRPIMYSDISKSVSQKNQGSVLGVANSLGSIAQIFGPLIGGFMLNYFFPGSLGLVSAAVMTIGLILIMRGDIISDEQ